MALLLTDGFDSYAATADLGKKWSLPGTTFTWNATAGRTGGGALQWVPTATLVYLKGPPSLSATTHSGGAFWLKVSAVPSASIWLGGPIDAAGVNSCTLALNISGQLFIVKGAGAITTVVGAGTSNVCDNQWHWIEMYTVSHAASAGISKLWIDGSLQYSGTGLSNDGNTRNQDTWAWQTGVAGGGPTITVDDFVFLDDTGTTLIASSVMPLGPRQITTVRAQADSAVSFATATGGSTHWNQVSEVNADGDTTYVESATSGDQDLYDYAALGVSPPNITAVMLNAYVENPNPGAINFQQIVKSGATTTTGATVQAPAAYRIVQQSFPQDPNTAAAWANAAAINNATFGIKVV